MIVLALLEIPEPVAADLACQVAAQGVSYRQRVRRMAERVFQKQSETVQVRWARIARQDADDLARSNGPGEGA